VSISRVFVLPARGFDQEQECFLAVSYRTPRRPKLARGAWVGTGFQQRFEEL